jgi:large subunit ribosomal protein L10
MPMNRAKKAIELKEVQDYIADDIHAIVVIENKGMTVKMVEALRREAANLGARYKVSKIALTGGKFAGIVDMFKGPTALILSKDPIAAAKVAQKFAKEYADKFVILGGAMEGSTLDAKKVVHLASLPSLDELRGKLVGLLQAPAQKLAALSQAPAAQLARVINAYAQKGA